LINCVEQLFLNKSATMFVNRNQFIIHPVNKPCGKETVSLDPVQPLKLQVDQFIKLYYPKQKFIKFVFDILTKHKLINEDLMFIDFVDIHVADFCSFISNPFNKQKKKNHLKIEKLCKYLRQKRITFPVVCIKNPLAQKYLCS
jgi:hypothetical protein